MKQSRQHGWLWQVLAILLALALTACGGGGGGGSAPPSALLAVTPTGLTFSAAAPGDTVAGQNVTIRNDGAASTSLTWSAAVATASGGNWLSINTTTGTLAGGQSAVAVASVNTTGLAYGTTYTGTITITATGQTTKVVNVSLTISAQPLPLLTVTPTTLGYTATAPGAVVAAQNATVQNAGVASTSLTWNATVATTGGGNWLSIDTTTGTLTGGQSATVATSVDTTGLAYGTAYSGTITVTAPNQTTQTVNVTLTIDPAPQPHLSVTTTPLTFTASEAGTPPVAQNITVTNDGDAGTTLNWSIANTQTWLSASPTSGSLAQNAAATVAISVNLTGLTAGSYTDTLTVSAPGQTDQTIGVTLTLGNALTANPASLNFSTTAGTTPASQTFTLANASSLNVTWTASEALDWLTLSPTTGTLTAGGLANTLTVSVTGNPPAGNYTGTITVTPGSGAVTGLSIPVYLTVTAAPAAAQSIQVGGTAGIGQLSSLVGARASRAALRKAAGATTPTVLADAKVTITVLKPSGARSVTSTVTNAQGAYSAQISADAGDTVTVEIAKPGYTSYIQTFTVQAGSSQTTVSGNLAEAATLVAQASGGVFKAGGGTTTGFRFGLMRKATGERATFASSSGIRAAATAGGKPEIDISIPSSWAPGATAVTAQLAAFDPNVPAERQMFPGEFVGVGGGTAQAGRASTNEYPLESVAFFQSEVTPNSGQPLAPVTATGASKAAPDPTIIFKYIPVDGCNAVKKYADRDSTVAGVQVPIYTYNPNTGMWGYLGEGTIKTWDGAIYTTVDAATLTDLNGTLGNLACGATDYYFEIVASEWYTWWNLDYPLLFAAPTTACISGTVRDQNGNPVPGAFVEADGYILNGANNYFYGYAKDDGTFSFQITLPEGKVVADVTSLYQFTAYNYTTWPASTATFTPTVNSDGSCPVATTNIVTVSDPATCTISGRLLEETTGGAVPLAGSWITAWNNDYSFYNWAETDAFGSFSMKSVCTQPVTLWAWGQEVTANVNGSVVGVEKTDNGSAVILNDIKRTNAPPEIWTWAWPNPAKAGQPVDLEAWSWDYEGDYPLTTAWTIKNSAGVTVLTSTLEWFTWTPAAADFYSAVVTVSDSKGNVGTQTLAIEVGEAGNSAPVIWWTWADPPAGCGSAPTLYADAYDPDGDTIEYRWQQETSPGVWADLIGTWSYPDGAGGTTALTGSVFSTATYAYFDSFLPDGAPTGAVQLKVSDLPSVGTAKDVFQSIVLPSGSGIDLSYAEAWPTLVMKGGTVDLYAYAWDNSAVAEANYTWSVTAPDGSAATVTPYTAGDNSWVWFTAAQSGTYQVTLTVTGACAAEPIVRIFTVTATTPGSVNVTID